MPLEFETGIISSPLADRLALVVATSWFCLAFGRGMGSPRFLGGRRQEVAKILMLLVKWLGPVTDHTLT